MRATITLHFREFESDPAESWSPHDSTWKSDHLRRISTGDLRILLEDALMHAIALTPERGSLTITLEANEP